MVIGLLQNKQKDNSIKTLKLIMLYFSEHGLQFKPTKVNVDFKQGLYEGIKHVWANTVTVGCRFHHAQSWCRKIQAVGSILL